VAVDGFVVGQHCAHLLVSICRSFDCKGQDSQCHLQYSEFATFIIPSVIITQYNEITRAAEAFQAIFPEIRLKKRYIVYFEQIWDFSAPKAHRKKANAHASASDCRKIAKPRRKAARLKRNRSVICG
jgi:hypothetical protein